ncbi:MAG: 16S rRNA (cytosine(1402)-N(4))-methyltransferase RsmH [Polyangiaceae bacterium]
MPAHPHVSVLVAESLAALAPRPGATFIDATLGAGGHSEAILETPGTRVIGIDRDPVALTIARRRLARFGDRFVGVAGRFSEIAVIARELAPEGVDGVLADVGVSSMQLDEADRGMSFRHEGPLDMRMDGSAGETALELIERLDDDELANVIYRLGDERRSRRVARCIKQALANGELHTTTDLRRAVVRAVGPARVGGVDPSTKTFQALRIAVNEELEELSALMAACPGILRQGGVVAIIAFHSLEDRIVKRALLDRAVWARIYKKPVVPSTREVSDNPRARSAKLRAARLLGPSEAVTESRGDENEDEDDEVLA